MAQLLPPISFSLRDIDAAARQLLSATPGHRIFAFSGHLGAGKTTFIQALCRQLGVKDHVSSPTFSLINEYRAGEGAASGVVYHMDWYRLRDMDEAINAGMEDCLQQQGVFCMVEWPEQAAGLLNRPHVYVTIEPTGEENRMLHATAY